MVHLVGFHCTYVSRCTVLRTSNTDGCQAFVNKVMSFRLSYIAVNWPTKWTPLIISRLTLLHSFMFIFIITRDYELYLSSSLSRVPEMSATCNIFERPFRAAQILTCCLVCYRSFRATGTSALYDISYRSFCWWKRWTYSGLSRRLFYAAKN
jgi:hypothetical protein